MEILKILVLKPFDDGGGSQFYLDTYKIYYYFDIFSKFNIKSIFHWFGHENLFVVDIHTQFFKENCFCTRVKIGNGMQGFP